MQRFFTGDNNETRAKEVKSILKKSSYPATTQVGQGDAPAEDLYTWQSLNDPELSSSSSPRLLNRLHGESDAPSETDRSLLLSIMD